MPRIPKTGSTSVVTALEMVEVEKVNPKYTGILVLRNPYDRILSMYHECKRSNHRRTESLSSWLARIQDEGYYNNHAAPIIDFLPYDYMTAGYDIYDTDALELIQIHYRCPMPHKNKTVDRVPWTMTVEEAKLAFMTFTTDFRITSWLTSNCHENY